MNRMLNIPNHTIVRKIGEGGMGTVFLATDDMLQRQVAIKVLKRGASADEDSMKRFRAEAVTLARLRNPGITMLYNLVRNQGYWCMIMEYVEGETLEARLKRLGTIPVEQVIRIAIQTLDGLQHAHDKGVIHRDMKPSNLMISPEGEVKIMDFGIARISGNSRFTRIGQAVGTPQYMSPEQIKGKEGDCASDIYSFGIVLYELLTGVTPFAYENEFQIMQAHTSRKPVPPAVLNDSIPDALNEAIMKALSKEPSKRFASAEDFKRCLEKIKSPEIRINTPKRQLPKAKFPDISKIIKIPDIRTLLKKESLPDYQNLFGFGFLAVCVIVALFLLFYKPESKESPGEKANVTDTLPDERVNYAEIEYPVHTEQKPSSFSQPAVTTQEPPLPVKEPKDGKSRTGISEEKKKTVKQEKKETKTENAPPEKKDPVMPVEKTEKEKIPETEDDKNTQPANGNPLEYRAKTPDRQVVVGRGTQIDVMLEKDTDFESAVDGARISLTVVIPLVKSGQTVINSGARATAVLHRNTRRKELTLEMMEVESVTGQMLKSFNTAYSAPQFPKGKVFKMYLDYNRVKVR
jgi:serine/threonine-protein kinase